MSKVALPFVPQGDPQVDVLARTLYGEARGEGEGGMRAVAHVILNRVRLGGRFGDSVTEVCLKPWQFSCWNARDPNRPKLCAALDGPDYERARRVAVDALSGRLADTTHGATHYYNPKVCTPNWAEAARVTAQIGRHMFCRDVQ